MSVQFTQNPQQVVYVGSRDDDLQNLQSPETRVPLDRMTSRLNPYSQVQEQLNEIQLDHSREERAERARISRIFHKVC
jgi:ABC-type microcin C transport system duplicated ATPase subunit YejF